MMSDIGMDLNDQLKQKQICRFCLSQDVPLTSIYSAENRKNSRVPLPLQIMSSISIEVFSNDEMPNTICNPCRLIMDYCYSFKQMCKKADTALKQFPLTSVWPDAMELPKYPLGATYSSPASTGATVTIKRKIEQLNSSPPKKHPRRVAKVEPEYQYDEKELNIEDMIVEFCDDDIEIKHQPKILNINNVKILNKQAPGKNIEPILMRPTIHTNEDGHIEIVSEILAPVSDDAAEPVMNAQPVETHVYSCEHCDRSFPLRQLLEIHAKNHVRDRKFACDTCQKCFFSKYDLAKHVLTHTGEKPFKCVVCSKAFSRSTLLHRHEKVHSDQPKFLCAYCERPFLSKEEWEKHTANHQKNRPFSCGVCSKTFAFKQGLERHQVVHSSDQPFKCEHCDLGFSTQGKLFRHLTAHAGERPYPCGICNKSYLLSHHRTRHMRSHKESSAVTYKCHECGEVYSKVDDLIKHSIGHGTKSLTCPMCLERHENIKNIVKHIKDHRGEQFACEFCELIFLSEDRLQEHSYAEHYEEVEIYDNDDITRKMKDKVKDEDKEDDNDDSVEDYEIREFEIVDEASLDGSEKDAQDDQNDSEPSREQEAAPEPLPVPVSAPVAVKAKKQPVAEKLPTLSSPKSSSEKTKAAAVVPSKKSPIPRAVNAPKAAVPPKAVAIEKSPPAEKASTKPVAEPVTVKRVLRTSEKSSPVQEKKSVEKPPAQSDKKPVIEKEIVTRKTTRLSKTETQSPPKEAKHPIQAKLPVNKSSAKLSSPAASSTPLPTKNVDASPKKTELTPVSPTAAAAKPSTSTTTSIKMQIGNKMVKVQQVRMTKAQIEQMTKQGKIEVRDGQMILKNK